MIDFYSLSMIDFVNISGIYINSMINIFIQIKYIFKLNHWSCSLIIILTNWVFKPILYLVFSSLNYC